MDRGAPLTLLSRAMRLRCPTAGRTDLRELARLVPNCRSVGSASSAASKGYWLGAYFFNLMAMETLFSIWVVGLLWWTWPTPPWTLFQVVTIALMAIVPFAFFPFSKTLFLAFDLGPPADGGGFRRPTRQPGDTGPPSFSPTRSLTTTCGSCSPS